MVKSRLPAEPVLVGRDEEIKQLMRCLDSALSGKGTTVFIYGEAGVGKTRLANEFLALAKKMGAKVLSGWCLSEAAIPYFPLTEAFNAYMSTTSDETERSTVKKHLGITGWLKGPEFARESKARELFSTPEIERDRTFEAVARVLLELSANEPLTLFIDDLQWADHLTLALLHYLSRKCRNCRLLIIGTYRPEELIRTKDESLHPLEEAMFSMGREDLLTKMELKRLKLNDFPEFLSSIFGSLSDEEFVKKLYEETEGNPFFALETLNFLVEEGFLSEKEDHWALTAPTEEIGIPSKVHELITRRIARLGREERKLLDLAAVCGYSFAPDTLSSILTLDVADVLQALTEIEQRHRLIRSIDSTFEFTHHKIREVIYSNLSGELRRIYHLKTASCLEHVLAEKISDSYLADVAFHYVEAGASEKAFEYLLKLGEKAVNIFANMQAIEYLDKALEATQKTPSLATSENLAKIYRWRGRAWLAQGEPAKAIGDFNLLLQNTVNVGDSSMMTEAHYLLGAAYTWGGDRDEAVQHLTTAIETAQKTGNKLIEHRSLGELAEVLMASQNAVEEGRLRLEESLRMGEEINDKVFEPRNLRDLGRYYNWRGEFNQAEETLNRAVAIAEDVGDNFSKIAALQFLSIVQAGKGDYNDATSTIRRCLQLSRDWGIIYFVPRVLNVLGWIYHDLGSIELARQYDNEALSIARAHQKNIGLGGVQPACLVNLGMDYLSDKDYENAEKCFNEANNVLHLHPWARWRFETRILLGLGELSLAKADYVHGLKFAEDSLAISETAGAKKYIAKGLKLKAEVFAEMGNLGEAIELMENALNLAQELGNPPLLWQTHYSLGLLLGKHGNLQKANEHYAEAIALVEETASKLKDTSLKNILLTAPQTKTIHDAYAKTKPTS